MIANESTHILVNMLLGGMAGLIIWLSVELFVEELRSHVGMKASGIPDQTQDTQLWRGHIVQLLNVVICGAFFASPVEFRWPYFLLGFLIGAASCALVFSLARRQKIQMRMMDWLFD